MKAPVSSPAEHRLTANEEYGASMHQSTRAFTAKVIAVGALETLLLWPGPSRCNLIVLWKEMSCQLVATVEASMPTCAPHPPTASFTLYTIFHYYCPVPFLQIYRGLRLSSHTKLSMPSRKMDCMKSYDSFRYLPVVMNPEYRTLKGYGLDRTGWSIPQQKSPASLIIKFELIKLVEPIEGT